MQYCTKCGSVLENDGACAACQPQSSRQQVPLQDPAQAQQAAPAGYAAAYPAYQLGTAPRSAKPTGARFFCEYILGLIPVGLFVLTALALLSAWALRTQDSRIIESTLRMCMIFLPLALGAVLTIRARGLDLSIVYVMGLSGYLYALTGSIVAAFMCAVLIGAINGALVVFLKLPATLTTLATGLLAQGALQVLSEGQVIPLSNRTEILYVLVGLTALVLFAGAFIYNMLTSLGKPVALRTNKSADVVPEFFAYPAASICAAVSGIFFTLHISAATPFGNGSSSLIYLVIIWATLHASKFFAGKYIPVICAALMLCVIRLYETGVMALGITVSLYNFILLLLALPIIIAAGFASWPFEKKREDVTT